MSDENKDFALLKNKNNLKFILLNVFCWSEKIAHGPPYVDR
jgi:hypothetical protein